MIGEAPPPMRVSIRKWCRERSWTVSWRWSHVAKVYKMAGVQESLQNLKERLPEPLSAYEFTVVRNWNIVIHIFSQENIIKLRFTCFWWEDVVLEFLVRCRRSSYVVDHPLSCLQTLYFTHFELKRFLWFLPCFLQQRLSVSMIAIMTVGIRVFLSLFHYSILSKLVKITHWHSPYWRRSHYTTPQWVSTTGEHLLVYKFTTKEIGTAPRS